MSDASQQDVPGRRVPGEYPERTTGGMIGLGFRGRCPRCGAGSLFSSYLKVAEKCNICALGFEGHDSGDATAVPALLLIGAIVVGGAMYVEFTYEPSFWVHIVLWGPFSIGATLWTLPRLKGIGIALQHRYRSTEEKEKLGGI